MTDTAKMTIYSFTSQGAIDPTPHTGIAVDDPFSGSFIGARYVFNMDHLPAPVIKRLDEADAKLNPPVEGV